MGNCDKPPCKTEGYCCDAKKQQIEECCPDKRGCPDTQLSGSDLKSDANVAKYHQERSKLSTRKAKGKFSKSECYYKRKCVLHPKKDTEKKSKPNMCCPSQTGHHIVPDSAMKSSGYCYDYDNALTVCVAGSGNRVGNHGLMHLRLCKKLRGGGKIKFSDLLENGMNAVKETLVDSGCDWKCLKKEIDKNHKEMSSTPEGKKKKGCEQLEDDSDIDKNCGMAYSGGKLTKIAESISDIMAYVNV